MESCLNQRETVQSVEITITLKLKAATHFYLPLLRSTCLFSAPTCGRIKLERRVKTIGGVVRGGLAERDPPEQRPGEGPEEGMGESGE